LFVDHTLAIAQLVVDVTVATRRGTPEILNVEPEPRCWRTLAHGVGGEWLKPDLFVAIGNGELEHRWFIEMDRATAHVPALRRKCHLYQSYYQTGREQAAHGVFPRVCWIVPDADRAQRLIKMLDGERGLTQDLFTVVVEQDAVDLITGARQ
jgi:hypothetical protein